MIKKIQEAFQKRKRDKTQKEFAQLIEKNPKDTRSRLKLGDLLGKAGKTVEAVDQYKTSAEIFFEAGFHLKAIALYKQILKLQPESVPALRRAAQISFQYGLYADAYPYYEALATIFRSQHGEEKLWELFEEISLLPLKETKHKIQIFESIFPEAEGSFTDPYNRLCNISKMLAGDEAHLEDALTLTRWLVGFYKDNVEGHETLLSLLQRSGKQAELQHALNRLEALYKANDQLEEKKDILQQYRDAVDWMTSSSDISEGSSVPSPEMTSDQVTIKMETDIYDILKKKANDKVETGTESEASPLERLEFGDLFENLKEGIKGQIAQDDSETHYNLAIAYQEMELFEDAIEEFTIACGNPALQHDAYFMIANCARELENLDEALEYYEKALTTGGLGTDQILAIRYEQAVTLRNAGRKKEALQIFQEINKRSSNYRDTEEQIQKLE